MARSCALCLLAVLLGASVAGCTSTTGYGTAAVKDEATVSAIEPGVSTKEDVEALLGEPTEVLEGEEGGESWHYVYVEIESTSYVVVQSGHSRALTVAVLFDDAGTVQRVRRGRSGDAGEIGGEAE